MIRVNEATAIRPMGTGDLPFVIDSWLKTFQFSKNRRHAERDGFFKCHYPVVRYLLEQSPRRVIACDPLTPDNIQGWCVGDFRADLVPVCHYCYVREAFAGLSLEQLLFSAVTGGAKRVVVSHLCQSLDGNTGDTEIVFDPYSIVLRAPPAAGEAKKEILVP